MNNQNDEKKDLTNDHAPTDSPAHANASGEAGEKKSFLVTWLLSWFVGSYGIDRFYLGFIWTGVFKLLTLGGLGFWTYFDFIRTGFGMRKDKQGRPLEGYDEYGKPLKIVTIVLISLNVAGIVLLIIFIPISIRSSGNLLRRADIQSIQSALKIYETNVSGLLPTTTSAGTMPSGIDICGPSCSDGESFTGLVKYQPSNISFQNYSSNLKVPNVNTIYLVDNYVCNAAGNSIGSQKTHSIAILYALGSSSNLKQECDTEPSYTYVDVDDSPFCGSMPSSQLSTAANQYLMDAIAANKASANISELIVANNYKPDDTIIQATLEADEAFLTEQERIKFSPSVEPDAIAQQNAIKNYDSLILQEDNNSQTSPTSLVQAIKLADSTDSSTANVLRTDLGLPQSTCRFWTP